MVVHIILARGGRGWQILSLRPVWTTEQNSLKKNHKKGVGKEYFYSSSQMQTCLGVGTKRQNKDFIQGRCFGRPSATMEQEQKFRVCARNWLEQWIAKSRLEKGRSGDRWRGSTEGPLAGNPSEVSGHALG